MDFGLVKNLDEEGTTQHGKIYGTPDYLSPEQALAQGGYTVATDVYAVAVLSYELLSGQLPYQSVRQLDTILQHVRAPIPPIIGPLAGRPALDSFFQCALAKEPKDRYLSVELLASALEQALADEKIVGEEQLDTAADWDSMKTELTQEPQFSSLEPDPSEEEQRTLPTSEDSLALHHERSMEPIPPPLPEAQEESNEDFEGQILSSEDFHFKEMTPAPSPVRPPLPLRAEPQTSFPLEAQLPSSEGTPLPAARTPYRVVRSGATPAPQTPTTSGERPGHYRRLPIKKLKRD